MLTQTDKAVESGNRLIAEFMEVKHHPKSEASHYYGGYKEWQFPDDTWYETENLKYHSSWDWLMPVVEKIGNTTVKSKANYNPDLRFRIEIVNGYTKIEGTGERIFTNSSVEGGMLTATYKAVIEFITWYNNYQLTLTKISQP